MAARRLVSLSRGTRAQFLYCPRISLTTLCESFRPVSAGIVGQETNARTRTERSEYPIREHHSTSCFSTVSWISVLLSKCGICTCSGILVTSARIVYCLCLSSGMSWTVWTANFRASATWSDKSCPMLLTFDLTILILLGRYLAYLQEDCCLMRYNKADLVFRAATKNCLLEAGTCKKKTRVGHEEPVQKNLSIFPRTLRHLRLSRKSA